MLSGLFYLNEKGYYPTFATLKSKKTNPQLIMKIKILLICLLATTLFNGCKKDEEPTTTPTPTSKKATLIDKNWKQTAWTVNPAYDYAGTGAVTNLIGYIAPCELDNITVYTTSNTYTEDEAATKCSAGNPQTKESGSWAFNSGETTLTRTPTVGVAEEFTIATLNETTLSLNKSMIIAGVTYVFTETYTKQ